jgi:hypothetical protein
MASPEPSPTFGHQHADHLAARNLVGCGKSRDAIQCALDLRSITALEPFVADLLDDRVIRRHRKLRQVDQGGGVQTAVTTFAR